MTEEPWPRYVLWLIQGFHGLIEQVAKVQAETGQPLSEKQRAMLRDVARRVLELADKD